MGGGAVLCFTSDPPASWFLHFGFIPPANNSAFVSVSCVVRSQYSTPAELQLWQCVLCVCGGGGVVWLLLELY